MKRNKQEEKEKRILRLIRRNDIASDEASTLEWVPVEEPQFLGWDIQVVLGDSGLRRGDIDNLLAVMHYFKVSRPTFTRHEWVAKVIKQNNGKYVESLKQVHKACASKWKYHWGYYAHYEHIARNYMPYFEETNISQNEYDSVPLHLKGYFTKHTERATIWRPEYYYYRLSSKFPRYELRLKVTKSYSTHKGIPNGEAQSEHQKLQKYLWYQNNAMSLDRYRGDHDSYYHKMQNQVQRKSWKQGLGTLAKRFDPEVAEEVIEHAEKVISSRACYETW